MQNVSYEMAQGSRDRRGLEYAKCELRNGSR